MATATSTRTWTWEELHRHFEAAGDLAAWDRLDLCEWELLKSGRLKPLVPSRGDRPWAAYWQTIADEYLTRHGAPKEDPR